MNPEQYRGNDPKLNSNPTGAPNHLPNGSIPGVIYPGTPPGVDCREPLRQLFSGLVESELSEVGIASPPLSEYLGGMLVERTHVDSMRVLDPRGDGTYYTSLSEIRAAAARRPFYEPQVFLFCREGGDFALFTAGFLCGETRRRSAAELKKECIKTGGSLYRIAAEAPDQTFPIKSELIRNLAEDFELVSYVLHKIAQNYLSTAA